MANNLCPHGCGPCRWHDNGDCGFLPHDGWNGRCGGEDGVLAEKDAVLDPLVEGICYSCQKGGCTFNAHWALNQWNGLCAYQR